MLSRYREALFGKFAIMRILVTGGAGFIGSALVRHLILKTDHEVVNLDKLTYAANPQAIAIAQDNPRYRFECTDICDGAAIASILEHHAPHAVMHLAAE